MGRSQTLWEDHLSRSGSGPTRCHALYQANGLRWLAEGRHDDCVAGGERDHHGGERGADPRGQRCWLIRSAGGHPGNQRDEVHVLLGVHLYTLDWVFEKMLLDLHNTSVRRQRVK